MRQLLVLKDCVTISLMGLFDKWLGKESASKNAEHDKADADSPEHIHMACAALLLEVAEADYADDPSETQAILKALEVEFGLTHQSISSLLERARQESSGATDLFPYTHLLNQRLDHEQKCRILTGLWRVAFADGNIDKYEEHLIRRVQGLLHLDHSDFIAAKQAARPTQS